ncbi:MAG TPA: hypothetical protein P5021_05945, partial [Candidatus Diapherotrites archaeon]|nr:hypothetical protein [Candidatus Diapherotrites archaeon]
GSKYYIIPEEEDKVFEIFRSLPDMLVRELGKLFNTKKMPVKRMLFESIIPEITDLLGLKAISEYQDILIGLLEFLAEESGVERFRIYSVEEFMKEIKSQMEGKSRIHIKRPVSKGKKSLNTRLAYILKRKSRLGKAAKIIFDAINS